ncbi:hypothetical protein NL676_017119 [Syzygium grande]|nr:hypothetical protein NL676_017119 [Syzygium grande]
MRGFEIVDEAKQNVEAACPSTAQEAFAAKGFNLTEMVTLLGGHIIGVAHCGIFLDYISDFRVLKVDLARSHHRQAAALVGRGGGIISRPKVALLTAD